MKKRILVLMAITTLSILLLAGCGSSSATEENKADTDTAEETEAVEETGDTAVETEAEEEETWEKPPVLDDLSSYDAIISQLQPGQAYAFADIDADNDALLVTSYTYDNGDGNLAAIDANIYGFRSDGTIQLYGSCSSDGTAYPLAVYDQCIMYGGNHHMEMDFIDEECNSMCTKEYASVYYDENGTPSYSYMSLETQEEQTPEDDTELMAMYDKYSQAVVVNFTVVE